MAATTSDENARERTSTRDGEPSTSKEEAPTSEEIERIRSEIALLQLQVSEWRSALEQS